MQYLVAVGLVVFFLAVWVGVDYLSQKRGLRNYDKPRTTCQGCQCGDGDKNTCQIQEKKEQDHDETT